MTHGMRVGSAVILVQALDRSATSTPNSSRCGSLTEPAAALLVSPAGRSCSCGPWARTRVIRWAGRPPVQDLDRRRGRGSGALNSAQGALRVPRPAPRGGAKLVEGHDPDDTVVMVTYPSPNRCPPRLPVHIFGWSAAGPPPPPPSRAPRASPAPPPPGPLRPVRLILPDGGHQECLGRAGVLGPGKVRARWPAPGLTPAAGGEDHREVGGTMVRTHAHAAGSGHRTAGPCAAQRAKSGS